MAELRVKIVRQHYCCPLHEYASRQC
jgi:hypothetical protein